MKIFFVIALWLGSWFAFAEGKPSLVVETPFTHTSIDISVAKQLAHLDAKDAIARLRSLGFRVGIYENARIVEGIKDAAEIKAIQELLASMMGRHEQVAGLYFSKGAVIYTSEVRAKEDTILLAHEAKGSLISHEYLHAQLSKIKKSYLNTQLPLILEADNLRAAAKKRYYELAGENFNLPKDLSREFVEEHKNVIEAEVTANFYALYLKMLTTIDELDVHTLLRQQEFDASETNLVVGAYHTYLFSQTVEKVLRYTTRLEPHSDVLTAKTVDLIKRTKSLGAASLRIEKDFGAVLKNIATPSEKFRLLRQPLMARYSEYLE